MEHILPHGWVSMSVKRQRWLIIADSLALPRPGVRYEATWPYLLQERFIDWDWVNLANRSSTTRRLVTDGDVGSDCLEAYAPDGVILHLGICDCAPRLYRHRSILQHLIFRLPSSLSSKINRYVERILGRQISNAIVSADWFRANLENYLQRCNKSGTQVIALEIFPVGGEMLGKNPEITSQIVQYNRIYRELELLHANLRVLSVFEQDEKIDEFTVDGYHLNDLGNEQVAMALKKCLPK